jgi:hypothetical protein
MGTFDSRYETKTIVDPKELPYNWVKSLWEIPTKLTEKVRKDLEKEFDSQTSPVQ